ncbi:MAG: S8 family serine peptidase [Pseudomonadales bacterium]
MNGTDDGVPRGAWACWLLTLAVLLPFTPAAAAAGEPGSTDLVAAESAAQPDGPATRSGYPNDPYAHSVGSWGQTFDDQWALPALRAYPGIDTAREPAVGADAVIVAVIDTGVDYQHEDLAADRLWRNPDEQPNGRDDDLNGYADDFIGWNFVDGDNNPWDQSGHGTHIAGIIAACTNNAVGIAAVNPDARIMALKVADFQGQARSSAVAAAIYYAVDNGARVINLSLGGEVVTEAERRAASYAAERDVLVVVSAGNRGTRTTDFGYASLPDVLVVGASGPDGARAGFSNFGAELALLAPGVDVLSLRARDTDFIALSDPLDYPPGAAIVGENDAYYRASGTSFAAANVSGLASRLLSLRPELHAREARDLLLQSARDLEAPGVDQRTGFGHADLVAALGAQPGRLIEARLIGVDLSLADQQIWLHIQGTARAPDFAGAVLEFRPDPAAQARPQADAPEAGTRRGREPKAEVAAGSEVGPDGGWQPLVQTPIAPTARGELAAVSLESMLERAGDAGTWELRLQVRDASGTSREARMAIELPRPAPPQEPADE